ncbi:hypothetical protein [Hymenobacter negativus]|uniref:Uncharacterized protein n=1 Tax=Hymenobacter negativus TaxID=2795026 RepID=A0ABS3QHI1_9BACT|nr:hypothetical protein [Hymenobacter negativus]MBO2010710.1 hypothetical protein [Hymenobacter negativus]
MKGTLLLLLLLLKMPPAATPGAVRVTFSALTKAAYLEAKKVAVLTKPAMTFPLKKAQGRVVIPTAKGSKAFQDNAVDEENPDWEKYTYLGYWPQFGCHLILHNHYEWSNYILLNRNGQEVELCEPPIYSPDLKSFVAISSGIEYWANSNSIQLFRFQNGTWRQIWKVEPAVEPATWEPNEIYWLSANSLILKKRMWTGKNPGGTYTYAKLTIRSSASTAHHP